METTVSKTAQNNQVNDNLFYLLHQGTKIKNVSEQILYDKLRELIKKAYFEAGFDSKLDKQSLDMITGIVSNDIKKDFSNLTLEETAQAFKMGVRKKFGDYFGISVVTIILWLEQYSKYEDRLTQIIKYTNQASKIIEKTQEEINEIMKDVIPSIISEYKKYKTVNNFGNARYDYLVRHNKIDEFDYQNYLEEAEILTTRKIQNSINDAKLSLDKKKVIQLESEFDTLIDGNNKDVEKLAYKLSVINWAKINENM